MRRAESTSCSSKALDRAFFSTAALPLFLLLGSGLSIASGRIEPPLASAQDTAQDEPPVTDPEALIEQEEGAEELTSTATDDPPPEVEPPAETSPYPERRAYASAAADSEPSVSGYLNLRTRSRWLTNDSEDDHDLYGAAAVDLHTGGEHSWGVHLMVRGSWALNSQEPGSVFYGVQDTYDSRLDGRIYRAYVDAPVGGALALTRLGRMAIYETPATAYFDGVQVETKPVGPTHLVVGAYGGLSVHLFESWPSDELMGGLYARFRPWEDGQMRLDWMHLDDDERFGDGQNDLVSAGLIHRLGKDLRLEGDFSLLDGKGNDLHARAFWIWPEQDMTVRVAHYQLLEPQRDLAYELNPYFNFLNTYFPYDETTVVVSKAFDDKLDLYGGVDTRRVDDEGDIGRFNRDYDRYFLNAAMLDLLPHETTLSLTGEVWDSPDNDVQSWGLDLTSQLREDTKGSIGSYYSLYKYYFDVDTEREDVRTYYAELRKTVSESTNLMARYEFEDEELDSYHNLRLGVTWRF